MSHRGSGELLVRCCRAQRTMVHQVVDAGDGESHVCCHASYEIGIGSSLAPGSSDYVLRAERTDQIRKRWSWREVSCADGNRRRSNYVEEKRMGAMSVILVLILR